MSLEVYFHVDLLVKLHPTDWALKGFLSSVDPQVPLQLRLPPDTLATNGTGKLVVRSCRH